MKSVRMNARGSSYARRSIGAATVFWLTIVAFLPTVAAAADRDLLYAKAEELIQYTNDVKGLSALIAQGVDVRKPGQNSQGRTLLFSSRHPRQGGHDGRAAQGGRRSQRPG